MFLGAWLHWRVPLSLPCAQDPHSSLGDLAPSGPQEGLIALPPAHQATSGMRVRGRSAEGGLRVPDSRTSVWWRPWCPRPRVRGGLRVAAPFRAGAGCRASGAGLGAGAVPLPLLASDTPAAPGGLPSRRGEPRATPGWQLWCEPHLPDQTGARGGRGGGRAWESGWDEGVPFHGDPPER